MSDANLLVTEVSQFFVTQGQHSRSFPRHFLVDVVVTFGEGGKLWKDTDVGLTHEGAGLKFKTKWC